MSDDNSPQVRPGGTIEFRQIWPDFKNAIAGWSRDRVSSMGAALAYYTAFSLAPLLIIIIAVAGLFFGRDAAQEALVGQLGNMLGDAGAAAVEEMLRSNSDFGTGITSLLIGIGALILGATTAFVELQDDLDRIWHAPPRLGGGILTFIRQRMLSFGMVLFVGFLLTVSLSVNTAIAAIGKGMFAEVEVLLQAVSLLVSCCVTTALFAMMYKFLPNQRIAWSDAWTGAILAAALFELGKFLIGLYIGKSEVASSFGSAGPFVILMLWVYYSTQIFLLGVEFMVARARRRDPELARQKGAVGRDSGAPRFDHPTPTSV